MLPNAHARAGWCASQLKSSLPPLTSHKRTLLSCPALSSHFESTASGPKAWAWKCSQVHGVQPQVLALPSHCGQRQERGDQLDRLLGMSEGRKWRGCALVIDSDTTAPWCPMNVPSRSPVSARNIATGHPPSCTAHQTSVHSFQTLCSAGDGRLRRSRSELAAWQRCTAWARLRHLHAHVSLVCCIYSLASSTRHPMHDP